MKARAFAVLFAMIAAACGSRILDTPEAILKRELSPGERTLTVLMKSCSDQCSVYSQPKCSVEIDGTTVRLEVSIEYEDNPDVDPGSGCSVRCGPPVYVHCDVSSLAAGTYTVEAETFRDEIVVK